MKLEINEQIVAKLKNEAAQRISNEKTSDMREWDKYIIPCMLIIFGPIILICMFSLKVASTLLAMIIICLCLAVPSIAIAKMIGRKSYRQRLDAVSSIGKIKAEIKGEVLFLRHPDGKLETFDIPDIEDLKFDEYNVVTRYDGDTGKVIDRMQYYSPSVSFRFLGKKYNFPDYYSPSLYEALEAKMRELKEKGAEDV